MKGKTVIITGASSGIGKACALFFAARGSNLVITGRNDVKLSDTLNEIHKAGAKAIAVNADVSIITDAEKIINEAIREFKSIDVLINNAGISMRGLFSETRLEVLHQLMNTNFWGTVYCTHFALPHILKNKGSVVGISSIAGKKGLPGRTGYSASKFAMEGFLETLRTENMKKGLHVLVACPGFTASAIRNAALGPDGKPQSESPLDEQKLMPAETVAKHIYRAVENRKRDLVLTSNGKLTIFLNKLFPAWVDKLVYNHMAKEPGSPF